MNNKIVLNVGCGKSPLSDQTLYFNDWKEIRVDAFENDTADIISTILDLKEIESESVDAVWASHIIEHCYFHELPGVFNSIIRVLKSDGFAVITVPDLVSISDKIKTGLLDAVYHSPEGPISAIDMIYGSRYHIEKYGIGMAHKTGFTEKSISQILSSLNIKALTKTQSYEVVSVLYKSTIPDYINHN